MVLQHSRGRKVAGPDGAAEGVYWIEECVNATEGMGRWLREDSLGQEFAEGWYEGEQEVHLSINAYVLRGSEKTLVFDTLSLGGTEHILSELRDLLDDDGLNYIVPSHDEAPHAGNANIIHQEFPEASIAECTAPGSNPELHRMAYGDALEVTYGDTIKLGGGYEVEFVEPVFLDSAMTTWLFEKRTQTLFTVDSFGFTHTGDYCGMCTDEREQPLTAGQTMQYHGRSLRWLQYADERAVKDALETVFERHDPEIIAPGHGQVFRGDVDHLLDLVKQNLEWIVQNERQLEVNFSL